MAYFKKNVWLLFNLIVFLWLTLLVYLVLNSYLGNRAKILEEQSSFVRLKSVSVEATFQQYEMVLDMLVNVLADDKRYTNLDSIYETIDSVLKADNRLIDISMINTDGFFYATTSRRGRVKSRTMNLLKMPETSADFKRTLSSHHSIVGRTYYNKPHDKLVLAIRRAVRSEGGQVKFILSLVIDIKAAFSFIDKQEEDRSVFDSYIFRDSDRFFQLAPKSQRYFSTAYSRPISDEVYSKYINNLEEEHQENYNSIKLRSQAILLQDLNPIRSSLTTSTYIHKYGLWLTSETLLDSLYLKVLKEVTSIFIVMLVLLVIIFYAFKAISRHQKTRFKELETLVNQDYLTKVKNRHFLEVYFPDFSAKHSGQFVYLDLDKFKMINNFYGHNVGDLVLKGVANMLVELVAHEGVVIRYSGDEFVLLVGETSNEEVLSLCNSINDKLGNLKLETPHTVSLSASFGIVPYSKGIDETADSIKRSADLALIKSKEGASKVTFFSQPLRDKFEKSSKIQHELKYAISRGEIYNVYQPQVDQNGEVVGIEVLARWDSSSLGHVPPNVFIPVAESTGEILKIGESIARQASIDLKKLYDNQPGLHISISLNVSVVQLYDDEYYASLVRIYDPSRSGYAVKVILEVTESVFIDNQKKVIELLSKLKKAGFLISLDDFGTGYSSLSMLSRLPIDELKIDQSFVKDIAKNEYSYHMVEGIVRIAKNVGLNVVVEGVETLDQLDLLLALDCDVYQGYLFSKPMRIDSLGKYISVKPYAKGF